MDQPLSRPVDQFAQVLDWIEQHLDDSLSVEIIAARASLSPYHFSRLFSARTGNSVMSYVRARRLIRIARALIDDPAVRLIDLALDSGFESQEAFTRAFRRIFGVSPGRFRQGFAVAPIEGQYPMATTDAAATVARLPELMPMPAFTVAGPSARFDETTRANIPQLWSKLIGGLPFAGQEPDGISYGVVSGVDSAEGTFDYMAGVTVTPDATLPAGFAAKRIEAASYAIFRITMNGGAMQPQFKAAMAKIWGDLIPASGLKIADGPDFERYASDFEPTRAGAVIDFFVPVEG